MDILKSFVLDGTEHKINILWDNDKPLFRASEIAKVLDIKDVHTSLRNFDNDEKGRRKMPTLCGDQEILYLTEQGVYRLLMRSNKPIARPFQKWVCDILVSIRETGKYELQKEIEQIKEETEIKINKIKEESEEKIRLLNQEAEKYKLRINNAENNALIDSFNNKYVVYFGKIRDFDNERSLIKIGSTKCIKSRIIGLREEFGSMTLFKIFECGTNEQFEKFLHKHKDIAKYAYKDIVYNDKTSTEVFLMNDDQIQRALNIAIHNVYLFRNENRMKNLFELEKIRLEYAKTKVELENIKNKSSKGDISDDEDISADYLPESYLPIIDDKIIKQTKGDKIQRYSSDGKTLIKTYSSIIEVSRDTTIPETSRNCILEASKNNTLYKNYRWKSLDRKLSDDTIQILEPTNKTIQVNIGFVAMLNLEKNKIIRVFMDQKEAGEDRKFKSGAPISKAIKLGTQSGGHYFMMWHNCSTELQEEYLSREKLPNKRINGSKIQIQKINPVTNEIIKEYTSINDVIKEHKISRLTLNKCIDNNLLRDGFYWKKSTLN